MVIVDMRYYRDMRTAETQRTITITAAGDDLLTTGEAAAILGSTRQHVLDLIRRGDLAAALVGTHHRVRRADVEMIKQGSMKPTRDQRRSLWLGHAIAGKVVVDPQGARAIGQRNVEKMLSLQRGSGRRWLLRWDRLLKGPTDDILAVLTSNSVAARELRQHNPFAGLLDEETRKQVIAATGSGRE